MVMKKKILILYLLSFVLASAFGQKAELNVLTKSEEKSVSTQKIKRIEINTERTDIIVKTWNENKIKLEIEYISKHALKTTAEKELSYLNMLGDASGGTYYVKSLIKLGTDGKQPQASLSFRLIITLPGNMPLKIKNKLGKVDIENSSLSSIILELELCHLSVSNSNLKGKILQKFGECQIENSSFEGTLQLTRTLSRLEFIKGIWTVISESGRIHLVPPADNLLLKLTANKTEIEIMGKFIEKQHIKVKGDRTVIDISDKLKTKNEANGIISLGSKKSTGGIDIQNVLGSVRVYSY